MADDGHMLRGDDIKKLAEELGMVMTTVKDLKEYRKSLEEETLKKTNPVRLPSDYGDFVAYGFLDKNTGKEHIALVKGDITDGPVLTRVHSECLTGDVLGSKRCDCGSQLHTALKRIDERGKGVLLYMRQEGRGIGLFNKLRAYELQEKGYDTVDANIKLGFPDDLRDYDLAAKILKDLGVEAVELMTNNPDKINQLEKYGIRVEKRSPIEIESNEVDKAYLKTKVERMGHELREFKEYKNA